MSSTVALAAAGALVLAACGGGGTSDPTTGETGSEAGTAGAPPAGGDAEGLNTTTQINVGWNQAFYEYNSDSATGNATANNNIKYMMNGGFVYYDENLELQDNTEFGTLVAISGAPGAESSSAAGTETSTDTTTESGTESASAGAAEPLVVEYTIAEGTTWSDGQPVSAADVLLQWAALSGHFNTVEEETDDEGEVTNQEALDAGVFFNFTSPTVGLVEEVPEISDDMTTLTANYTVPFADYRTNFGVGVPAHVVAMHALDITDPDEAVQTLVEAIQNNDAAVLGPVSQFWNTGFAFDGALPEDESLYLSNGPYLLTELNGEEYVTLERNPDYTGEWAGEFDTITVRYNEDPGAQVQAMQNEEISVISPQATADLLTQIEGLGEPFEFMQESTATYEHIDLAQNNGGPFDPAAYGGDAETARMVRQAFLTLIPRQQILETLINPLNPDAQVRNSYTQTPQAPGYEAVASANGMQETYAEPDPAAAQAMLEEAGVTTPIDVRVLYGLSNQRRAQTFTLLQETLAESGLFNLVDAGSDDWGNLLSDTTTYDAALFGWQSTSTAVTESDANFRTGGGNNFYGYSNPEVDALYDQLQVEVEPEGQIEILSQIESILVDDAFGITIYQHPGVTAWNTDVVSGIAPIAIAPTLFWNFNEWVPGSAASAS